MSGKPDFATVLSNLREKNNAEFYVGLHGDAFTTLVQDEKIRTLNLESRDWDLFFRALCRRNLWDLTEYRRDVITQELTSIAFESGEQREVFVRVGNFEENIYIDLNNENYECVQISDKGYKLTSKFPVPFVRSSKQGLLPRPIKTDRKTFIKDFQRWFGTRDQSWILVLAFLLKCLHRNHGSYVILVIEGPQGSGKSAFSGRLKMLIDPAEPKFFSPPTIPDDVIVASVSSFLLAFDNISGLPGKMADIFCRLATGGGISKRKHYENHGEAVYHLHRAAIINGIDEPTTRPDFQDRTIKLKLQPMEEKDRISETELNQQFSSSLPTLLGGLYQLFAECLHVLPSVQTKNLPRMTDFTRMGIAIELVLGLKKDTFVSTYEANRAEQAEDAFWNDELCCTIHRSLLDHRGTKEVDGIRMLLSTSGELKKALFRDFKNSPRTLHGFSGWLKRIEPLLRAHGIVVDRDTYRKTRARIIAIYFEDPRLSRVEKIEAQDTAFDEEEEEEKWPHPN